MSRSGYVDDCDNLSCYRGAVASAIRGRRGQDLLSALCKALDEMPIKELIAESLVQAPSAAPEVVPGFCALGALGHARGMDIFNLDPDDWDAVADAFGVSSTLVREIVYENDECGRTNETPAQRWERVREWVASQIILDEP